MTHIERIRIATPEEMADMMERWIVRCSRNCPALSECREGMSCRRAILAWLIAEEEWYERHVVD